MSDGGRAPDRVQSVERAVAILQFLARNGWSGVTEVGTELGVHKSTAFRLLSTLEAHGLVEQHVDSGKYHLGFGLVYLARAVSVGPDLSRHAQPSLEWLADEIGETVTLAVLEGDEAVTIDQLMPETSVVSRSWIGRRNPLHCTSVGKVFLASLPRARTAGIINNRHVRWTDRTIVDPLELRADIERVREQGYATNWEEFEEGLASVAAPVRAVDGTVVAALSISGPSYRLSEDALVKIAESVREAAARTSARLGAGTGLVGIDR
jgi:DNA-binding IclR family transcriptional regulator